MKNVFEIPDKPTRKDAQQLENYFYLPGWQFETLIVKHCTEIFKSVLSWKKGDCTEVVIYGLMAMKLGKLTQTGVYEKI
jgi:hypothetical protein